MKKFSGLFSTLLTLSLLISLLGIAPGPALARSATPPAPTQASLESAPECLTLPSPSEFVSKIDNPYLPLEPGTIFTHTGMEDGELETNVIEVTTDTKVIQGVTAVVVLDIVRDEDGALVELTYDWFAQDRSGNVWYMGEDSKEYEEGAVVSTAGSWEAGVNGAKAGIIMKAHPRVGDAYSQECAPGVAEDAAEVIRRDVSVSTTFGAYNDVVVIREFSSLQPNVEEQKYYAPCVGFVKVVVTKGGVGEAGLVDMQRTS